MNLMRVLLCPYYFGISASSFKPRFTSTLTRFVHLYLDSVSRFETTSLQNQPVSPGFKSQVRFKGLDFKSKVMDSTTAVRPVDIDGPGNTFKYILLKLTIPKGEDTNTFLVRGYSSCAFHGDIYDIVDEQLKKKFGKDIKWKLECLGGGRIRHEPKKIHIYGYSQGYGQADHKVATELIKTAYGDQGYEVTWSNEGY